MLSIGAVWDAGVFGVDLFFVLSSFLITRLLLAEQAVGGISIGNFYLRRVLRIWPLYFGFLTALWALAHFAGLDPIASGYWAAFFLLVGNWACVVWGYPHSGIAPLWSVCVEEQFYLLWPFCVKFLSRRGFVGMCVGLLVVSMVVKVGLAAFGAVHPAAWNNSLGRLEPIALGALLACRPTLTAPAREGGLWLRLIAACCLLVIANAYFPWDRMSLGSALLTYPAAALASAVFVRVALQSRGLLCQVLSIRPMVYLGRISFGLYVFHLFVLQHFAPAVRDYLLVRAGRATGPGGLAGLLLYSILACGLTLLLAVISYEFVEKRFLWLKLRFTRIESRPGG